MIKPKITKLKYPLEIKEIDGKFKYRCGWCGRFYPKEEFIENPKESLKRSAYCEDCRKYLEVYE